MVLTLASIISMYFNGYSKHIKSSVISTDADDITEIYFLKRVMRIIFLKSTTALPAVFLEDCLILNTVKLSLLDSPIRFDLPVWHVEGVCYGSHLELIKSAEAIINKILHSELVKQFGG